MTQANKINDNEKYWVFIGASAGGLEALKEFLSHFNAYDDCYVIIAQHLDPKHPTILMDLLGRITETPVSLITENIQPETGRIYIVSPGHNAKIENQTITLSPAAEIGPKPSVDLLLKSAASELQERTIAVILSGTGSDGAQGALEVKAHNGLVFVQDSQTAKYSGMPEAATETGAIDMVLPPERIASQIAHYVNYADLYYDSKQLEKTFGNLDHIFNLLFERTGYDFSGYKHKTVNRRIARRMAVNKIENIDDYIVLLEGSSTEIDNLFKDLLISVTSFFRDTEHFKALEKEIDSRIKSASQNDSLRVWVPGCANGEEAFSIAFLIYKACIRYNKDINFQVFATDIDESALNNGRKAYYSSSQLDGVDQETRDRFFSQKNGHYLVAKKIRERVLFAKHNLVMDPPFSKVDLISCRNLLIYFSQSLQKQIFHTFHFALKPDGILFLGKSENPLNVSPELFGNLVKRSPIFVRKSIDLTRQTDQVQSANNYARHRKNTIASLSTKPIEKLPAKINEALETELFSAFIPAAIIVDSSGAIIHLQGKVNDFLTFPQGKINMNVLSLIRDDLKIDLRALLQKAERDGKASSPALFFESKDQDYSLIITVQQLNTQDNNPHFYAIGFIPIPFNHLFEDDGKTKRKTFTDKEANDILRQEVENFKERLQTTVEELETTNEELQSTNEELQSANEELQSANEELQTSNEEMQSTNEELSTVNQELEIKSYELEQVNHDLESMLSNMSEAIVLIDNRLRLLRWTKVAGSLLNLDISHINQTITTVGLPIDITDLRQQLLDVIETREIKLLRVREKQRVFNLRIQPHYTENTTLSGIMLFFDEPQSEAKRLSKNIDCTRNFEILGNLINDAMIVIDYQGIITYINDKACQLTDYEKEDVLYNNIAMLMPEPFAGHHDTYLHDYNMGKKSGLLSQWRDISVLTSKKDKLLCQLKVEETWVNSERHFIGFIELKKGG